LSSPAAPGGDRPLLSSGVARVRSPGFPPEFVGRPAVVSRLVRCEAPLVLIVAPPGYGKTSLTAEWDQWDERPFFWLAPGREDGGELPDLIGTRRGRRPRVVVLDRAERLAPEGLAELAERLLDELAPGSTLVVCSRREPELPEGRLRAHRILFEVRRRELALSALQAAELLRLSGLEVDPGVAAALVRETDGWPAALYLAALSMRERREQQDGAARFLGDDHLLVEYVRDEIFSALTAEEARWLSLCSVADELTGPLCQALTGQPGSARMLPESRRMLPAAAIAGTACFGIACGASCAAARRPGSSRSCTGGRAPGTSSRDQPTPRSSRPAGRATLEGWGDC
jgi:LuxR family maltose regulon positive regulatory protein